MAIPMTGSVDALFDRLGKLGALVENLSAYQAQQFLAMTSTATGVVAYLNPESDVQALMGSSYINILSAMGSNIASPVQGICAAIANRMVFRDNPQLNQNLTSSNTLTSLHISHKRSLHRGIERVDLREDRRIESSVLLEGSKYAR